MSKVVQDNQRPPVVGTITQFLTTLPSPLTISLVALSPQIHFVRWSLEVLSWKGSWDESWLLLAAWWGVCLGAKALVRYLVPLLAVTTWWWLARPVVRHTAQPQPATEDTLQQTIADLTAIQQLLPTLSTLRPKVSPAAAACEGEPTTPSAPIPFYQSLRVLAFAYPPYLLLTLSGLIRLRTLVAIAGTIVILHRAPFALVIRRALWRSAYFRWSVYWIWAKVSGTPLPGSVRAVKSEITLSAIASAKSVPSSKDAGSKGDKSAPANAIRFLFTVYENQRWWMGLDFTAALLPGERPSWCTKTLQPCSPPAAFSLPPPTTVYIPEPTSAETKDKEKTPAKRVMKRTAVWSWDEPEWKVVVHKEGSTGNTRVERPLPSLVEEGASASAGRILRAAGKIRGASIDLSPEQKAKELDPSHGKEGSGARDGEKNGEQGDGPQSGEEEPFTDPDGWVYGDNKWEGGSAKGGLGKYTRYRRWTRVAVLTETVEWVDEADIPAETKVGKRPSGLPNLQSPTDALHPITAPNSATSKPETPVTSPMRKGTQDTTASVASPTSPDTPTDEGSRLRQRLKAAVNGVAR